MKINKWNLNVNLLICLEKKVLEKLHFVLCSITDEKILQKTFKNVDYVIHTAALKHIDLCEDNIDETINTNIIGTKNLVEQAINNNVNGFVFVSTDKSCEPSSVYGASKLIGEKLVLNANKLNSTKFSVIRCGNISGSHGSIIPFFKKLIKKGEKVIPITDEKMCRFWLTAESVCEFIDLLFKNMSGGEILIPKMSSFYIVDLVKALGEDLKINIIGLRKAEKINEKIFNETNLIYDCNSYFIEGNSNLKLDSKLLENSKLFNKEYSTAINDNWFTVEDLKEELKKIAD